jgi:hypothetical protein
MHAQNIGQQGVHHRSELLDGLGVAQTEIALGVPGPQKGLADHRSDRLGGAGHALTEDAGDLDHAVVGEAGVVKFLDQLSRLDVVVVVARLVVVDSSQPESETMAAEQVGIELGALGHLGEGVLAVTAEYALQGKKRQAVFGDGRLELLDVYPGIEELLEQLDAGLACLVVLEVLEQALRLEVDRAGVRRARAVGQVLETGEALTEVFGVRSSHGRGVATLFSSTRLRHSTPFWSGLSAWRSTRSDTRRTSCRG